MREIDNPEVRKFTSMDSMKDTLNPYSYAGNISLLYDDPIGRIAEPCKFQGTISASLCRTTCENAGYNPTLCRAACKLLKNCTCPGLKAAAQHEYRHGRKQLGDALAAVYFGLDC